MDIAVAMILHKTRIETNKAIPNPWTMVQWNLSFISGQIPYIEYEDAQQVDLDIWLCTYKIPLWNYIRDLFQSDMSKSDALLKCWEDKLDQTHIKWASDYWDTLAKDKAIADSAHADCEEAS